MINTKVKPPAGTLLKERAYVLLKGLIQDDTFSPGDFLSERQLAAQLGMSKTPVKAALERLELEGFIAVSPQQGIVVRDLSLHEVADQFELRAALETYIARALAGRLNQQQLAQLRDNLKTHRKAAEQFEITQSVGLDAEFHILLCEFHGNLEVIRLMVQQREKMHRVISRVVASNTERLIESVNEHTAIVDAIASGDAELSAREVERHLEYGKQILLSPRGRQI